MHKVWPDSDGDGDVREGLGTTGVVDDVPDDASLQQFPLSIRDVVGQVHFRCPVGHVNLSHAHRKHSQLDFFFFSKEAIPFWEKISVGSPSWERHKVVIVCI